MVTSIPSPPNSPRVWTCMSRKLFASMKLECGSRDVSIPLMADSMSLPSSGFST
jgi:hypothetical protein